MLSQGECLERGLSVVLKHARTQALIQDPAPEPLSWMDFLGAEPSFHPKPESRAQAWTLYCLWECRTVLRIQWADNNQYRGVHRINGSCANKISSVFTLQAHSWGRTCASLISLIHKFSVHGEWVNYEKGKDLLRILSTWAWRGKNVFFWLFSFLIF